MADDIPRLEQIARSTQAALERIERRLDTIETTQRSQFLWLLGAFGPIIPLQIPRDRPVDKGVVTPEMEAAGSEVIDLYYGVLTFDLLAARVFLAMTEADKACAESESGVSLEWSCGSWPCAFCTKTAIDRCDSDPS